MKYDLYLYPETPGQATTTVTIAGDFFTRLTGFLRYRKVPENHGILFPDCNAIHTFGMAFPIDILWLDGTGRVLKLSPSVAPWRTRTYRPAAMVLELPEKHIALRGIKINQLLEFRTCAK